MKILPILIVTGCLTQLEAWQVCPMSTSNTLEITQKTNINQAIRFTHYQLSRQNDSNPSIRPLCYDQGNTTIDNYESSQSTVSKIMDAKVYADYKRVVVIYDVRNSKEKYEGENMPLTYILQCPTEKSIAQKVVVKKVRRQLYEILSPAVCHVNFRDHVPIKTYLQYLITSNDPAFPLYNIIFIGHAAFCIWYICWKFWWLLDAKKICLQKIIGLIRSRRLKKLTTPKPSVGESAQPAPSKTTTADSSKGASAQPAPSKTTKADSSKGASAQPAPSKATTAPPSKGASAQPAPSKTTKADQSKAKK